jgi:hypothetical protein
MVTTLLFSKIVLSMSKSKGVYMDKKSKFIEVSQLDGKKVENRNWYFLDCPVCAEAVTSNHRSKKDEHKFSLCQTCSSEIEKLKCA